VNSPRRPMVCGSHGAMHGESCFRRARTGALIHERHALPRHPTDRTVRGALDPGSGANAGKKPWVLPGAGHRSSGPITGNGDALSVPDRADPKTGGGLERPNRGAGWGARAWRMRAKRDLFKPAPGWFIPHPPRVDQASGIFDPAPWGQIFFFFFFWGERGGPSSGARSRGRWWLRDEPSEAQYGLGAAAGSAIMGLRAGGVLIPDIVDLG